MAKKKRNPVKFRLSTIQHRIQRLELLHDVIIEGEVVIDYVVGYVEMMGTDDPRYLNKCKEHVIDYTAALDDIKNAEAGDEATNIYTTILKRFETQSVSNSIVGWDVEFFEEEFSEEAALKFFANDDNIIFYNQVSRYMQKRCDFLSLASM